MCRNKTGIFGEIYVMRDVFVYPLQKVLERGRKDSSNTPRFSDNSLQTVYPAWK